MALMLSVKDVMELLNTSESTAYKVMRECNAELQSKGYLTLRGRIPRAYLLERVYGGSNEHAV